MRSRRHRGESRPAVPGWLQRGGEHVPAPRSSDESVSRIAELAEQAGAPVADVLREVADFRLALETDMIIAAAAADADELGLVAEVIDGERAELAALQQRMLSHLSRPESTPRQLPTAVTSISQAERITRRARLVAAAAALVALVGGGLTATNELREVNPHTERVALTELADEQLSTLTGEIVRSASSADIAVAATELHATLDQLIAQHAEGDPAVAAMIADLIREEQRLLVVDRSGTTAGMLQDVARLARKLQRVAPPRVPETLPPVVPEAEESAAPRASASASPAPKPSASPKPSPKPSPSATSASPSASPSPAARPSGSASPNGGSGEDGAGGAPVPTTVPRP